MSVTCLVAADIEVAPAGSVEEEEEEEEDEEEEVMFEAVIAAVLRASAAAVALLRNTEVEARAEVRGSALKEYRGRTAMCPLSVAFFPSSALLCPHPALLLS